MHAAAIYKVSRSRKQRNDYDQTRRNWSREKWVGGGGGLLEPIENQREELCAGRGVILQISSKDHYMHGNVANQGRRHLNTDPKIGEK